MKLDRIDAPMILGARVWFCRLGATITGADNVTATVGNTVLPELPDSYATPGAWTCLGKVRTAKPQTDYKSADVEGVDDTGAYKITELKLATKRRLQFTTNDIAPEAFEMTFGLASPITAGGGQAVFASGNDTIECWLVLELTDAYRTETNLARVVLRGKLTLQNPLEAKSDPAQADYVLSVVPNALATFIENSIVTTAQGA